LIKEGRNPNKIKETLKTRNPNPISKDEKDRGEGPTVEPTSAGVTLVLATWTDMMGRVITEPPSHCDARDRAKGAIIEPLDDGVLTLG
jgi:hypothetical protein